MGKGCITPSEIKINIGLDVCYTVRLLEDGPFGILQSAQLYFPQKRREIYPVVLVQFLLFSQEVIHCTYPDCPHMSPAFVGHGLNQLEKEFLFLFSKSSPRGNGAYFADYRLEDCKIRCIIIYRLKHQSFVKMKKRTNLACVSL